MKFLVLILLVSCADPVEETRKKAFAHGFRAGCMDAMHSISTRHLDDKATITLGDAERATRVCARKMNRVMSVSGN